MWGAVASMIPSIIGGFMGNKSSASDKEAIETEHKKNIAGNSGPPTSAPSLGNSMKEIGGNLLDKSKEMLMGNEKGAGGVLQQAVSSITGRAIDKLGSEMFDKSPEQKGQAQKAYADAAFPRTTPWEQLGGGGHGQGGGVAAKAAGQEGRITEREKNPER